ncbi:unnamed protein product, partial [Clonostachys rosea]
MAAGHKIVPEDRVLLVGAAGVGKNSLIEQFCYGHVSEDYDPFRGEGCRKEITLDGEDSALDLLDVEFRGDMLEEYDFHGADAVMMVFSVASVESLRCAMEAYAWLRWQTMRAEGQVPVVLVGNMCDLPRLRQVSSQTGAQLARSLGMEYYETSAWDATSVERAFVGLARAARQRRQPQLPRQEKKEPTSRPASQGDEEEREEELYGQPGQLMQSPPTQGHRLRGHRLLSWGKSKLNLGRPTSQFYSFRDSETRTQKIQEGLLDAARRNDEEMFACYLRAASHDT